jgi:hypothetical protein
MYSMGFGYVIGVYLGFNLSSALSSGGGSAVVPVFDVAVRFTRMLVFTCSSIDQRQSGA